MKVLVTGGGGFLGQYIVKELISESHDVWSLSRNHYISLDKLGVKTIECDLSDSEVVNRLDLSDFDAIIHTAAKAGVWGDFSDYNNINYHGTKNLFDKAVIDKVKYFIYTSSPSVVFGSEDIILGDEGLKYPKKFYTHYAKTKARAEAYIFEQEKSKDIHVIALRPHLIWGPGDPHLFPRIIQKGKAGKLKRVGAGENLVDIIYVENAAMAHLQALKALVANSSISGNAYFIGQERPVNLWNFIDEILSLSKAPLIDSELSFNKAFYVGLFLEKIFEFMGIKHPEPPMTRFVALQLAKNHYFSHEKAKNDFGYSPKVTIEEGLKITFKQQHHL